MDKFLEMVPQIGTKSFDFHFKIKFGNKLFLSNI